jgi:short-subunit dehydrogenase
MVYNEPMKKQVALVTGASSGIGEATAIELQKNGYQVYAAARRVDRMDHLKEMGIHTISLDVTDDNSMRSVVTKIEKDEGMIDVLINNAGYGSYGALEDVPMSEARRQIDVNVFGLARMSQLVIPKMREAKRGAIINISSVGGKLGESFGAWYHTAKFAVEGLSDSLAIELKPFNIRVITIEPGAIKTEWAKISAENLIKSSGHGNYSKLANKKADRMNKFNDNKFASDPSVVAKKIVKVLSIDKPKFRYAVGGGAKSLMLIRKITSDKMFYRILNRALN